MIWAMINQALKRVEILYSSVETSPDHRYKADRATTGTSAKPARQERAAMITAMETNTDNQPDLSSNFKIKRIWIVTSTKPPKANRQPGCKSTLKAAWLKAIA